LAVASPKTDRSQSSDERRLPPYAYPDSPPAEWSFDCEFESTFNLGVTAVQDSLCWISAGQATLKIGVYNIADPSHPFRYSFAQTGGPSGWGIRDMAYDQRTDHVFAGFDNQRFHVYNATTRMLAGSYTITGYTGTVRAMAHHPLEDSLWTGDFSTSPMTKFSITGLNGHQVRPAATMGACYGLAFDTVRGCFWMTSAGDSGQSPFWRIGYPDYQVADSFNPPGWSIGGGCEMWRDTFLLAVEQGAPDRLWCFRVNSGPGPDHDVELAGILSPGPNVNPGSIAPRVRVRNLGATPESDIPITCRIDSAGTRVYDRTVSHGGPLPPGDAATIDFPEWLAGPAGNSYTVTAFTSLAGDPNPANDTATATTRTAGAVFAETLIVRRAEPANAPVIDGIVGPAEWAGSNLYDISDILNRSGTGAQPPGSCIARYLYDDAFMYYAVSCPGVSSRVDYDQFAPYVDENRSGTWSADSGEGHHWMEFIGADSAVYRALLNTVPHTWLMGAAPDAQSASSTTGGTLQFEAKVPFGARNSDYSISPGDTVGFFQYVAAGGGEFFPGWWPQSLTSSNWANPAYYGTMVLEPVIGIAEPGPIATGHPACSVTSPTTDAATITYSTAVTSDVRIDIFDAAGRLARDLVRARVPAGRHTTTWDRTDATGLAVTPGTYFVRLTINGASVSVKSVIAR
jgi:hypothetical protein